MNHLDSLNNISLDDRDLPDHILCDPKRSFIPAPEDPAEWPAWREALHSWSAEQRAARGPVQYDREAQAWASSCYALGFIMLWDNELIDHQTGAWNVDAFLDRAERDYSGYDAIVLWSNYPLSGVDNRHQIAYYDELPGGRAAMKAPCNVFTNAA